MHRFLAANLAGKGETGLAAIEQTVAMNTPALLGIRQLYGFYIVRRVGCRRTTGCKCHDYHGRENTDLH